MIQLLLSIILHLNDVKNVVKKCAALIFNLEQQVVRLALVASEFAIGR